MTIKNENLDYSHFLFSHIFTDTLQKYDTIYSKLRDSFGLFTVDDLFDLTNIHYKLYEATYYNDKNETEYMCIERYVNDTLKPKEKSV